MTEDEQNSFRRMLGRENLPENLVAAFNNVKLLKDRIHAGPFSPGEMALLCHQYGLTAGTAEIREVGASANVLGERVDQFTEQSDTPTPTNAVDWRQVLQGTPVVVVSNGSPRAGKFLMPLSGQSEGKLRVKFDDEEAEFRIVEAKDVALV